MLFMLSYSSVVAVIFSEVPSLLGRSARSVYISNISYDNKNDHMSPRGCLPATPLAHTRECIFDNEMYTLGIDFSDSIVQRTQ